MAPTKNTRSVASKQTTSTTFPPVLMPMPRRGLTRLASTQNVEEQNNMQTRGKRKADNSPINNNVKRSALGNLTNNAKTSKASSLHPEENAKQQMTKKAQVLKDMKNIGSVTVVTEVMTRQVRSKSTRQTVKPVLTDEKKNVPKISFKKTTTQSQIPVKNKKISVGKAPSPPPAPVPLPQPMVMKVSNKPARRISHEFNKTEESLYMSALEDISGSESSRYSGTFEAAKRQSMLLKQQQKQEFEQKNKDLDKVQNEINKENECKTEKVEETLHEQIKAATKSIAYAAVPDHVFDFDKANWDDPLQISHYAMDIFNYLKERESQFLIDDYMKRQIHLSDWMRSLLVDWMVEVQETFELNHETLYLAVKIVDIYLCREVIHKDKLQLLGAAAMFIACKFDERTPPLVDDFLFICDGAYKHDEVIKMEKKALRTIGYDLGIPLSYRFLRRYARCAKVSMPTLTLARYILELSLMDYETVGLSDSKLASAALFMALRLHGTKNPWTETLQYYSGYMLKDFSMIVPILNAGMHRKPKGTIKTIRSKYSHKIFHEVANVKLLSNEQFFELT